MPSTLEQLTPTRVKLTVEIPFSALQPSLDKVYRQIASQVNIPGFRKGHVPQRIIDQRVGRGAVLQDAINEAIPDAYGQAVAEHGVAPLGQPEIELSKLEDNDVVEFTAEVNVRPEFDLPDFSKVSVKVKTATVADGAIDERIDLLRQRFAVNKDVERAAKKGDVVVIDLKATKAGKVLPDGTAQGVTYRIGSGGMLDGLDKAVTGLKAGASAKFTSKLVGGELAGTEAEIDVKVARVQEQELPTVDDEFAQLVSQFDTVKEMRADLRAGLERMSRYEQAAEARDKVVEAVLKLAKFEVPQEIVDAEVTSRRAQVEDQLQQASATIEQYLANTDDEAKTPEEFWANLAKRAESNLRAQILLDKIADDRQIGVEQEDLTSYILSRSQQAGTTPEQEAQHMMDHNHLPEWMGEIRRSKALGLMVESAKISDEAGKAVDITALRNDQAPVA